MTTYFAIAADPKRLRDHFNGGVSTFKHYHDRLPAECRTHPETATLLAGVEIEVVPDARLPRWYLYFGPRPEGD